MPCPSIYAGKLWEAVQELGSTKTMSFGHDHVNDTWFTYKGVDFIYGKSIEYTVYADDAVTGGAQRGASEIHVRQNGSYYITENSLNEIEKNTAVMQEDGSWKYVDENHKVDASYTGAAWNGYTTSLIQNGSVATDWSGIVFDRERYIYFHNGMMDSDYQSVEQYHGNWWKITDGMIDFSFSGFASNKNGTWRIVNGKVDFSATGLIRSEENGTEAYVINGNVQSNFSGLIQNQNGWWHVKNGYVDYKSNDVVQNKYGWWKVTNGKATLLAVYR
jgi:hypothetical protein